MCQAAAADRSRRVAYRLAQSECCWPVWRHRARRVPLMRSRRCGHVAARQNIRAACLGHRAGGVGTSSSRVHAAVHLLRALPLLEHLSAQRRVLVVLDLRGTRRLADWLSHRCHRQRRQQRWRAITGARRPQQRWCYCCNGGRWRFAVDGKQRPRSGASADCCVARQPSGRSRRHVHGVWCWCR